MNLKLILTVLFAGVASAVRPLPHDGNLHVFFSRTFFYFFRLLFIRYTYI